MTQTKSGMAVALVGAFLVLTLLSVPMAAAQKPTFKYDTKGVPTTPVTPVEQVVKLDLDWTYTTPVGPLQGTSGVAAPADIKCPNDKIIVSGATTELFTLQPSNTQGTYTGTVTVFLTILREAPGMTPITCDITGHVGEVVATGVPATDNVPNKVQITPDYLPYIEAQSASKLRQGGPQKQIPFAIDLTNFGNAATKVNFAVDSAPKGHWQGLLPDPALLDPPGGNLQSKQIVFNVATPYKNGWNNDEGAFTISMTPEYQYNSEKKGSPITVTVLARVRGVYVPSLEPTVMVVALLGAAMVLRMRKDDDL